MTTEIISSLPPLFSLRRPQVSVDPGMHRSIATATAVFPRNPLVTGGCSLGTLAVSVAANRLLATGATPRYISATFTIDIDTPTAALRALADAMERAAVDAETEWLGCSTEFVDRGCSPYGVELSVFAIGQMPPDVDYYRDSLRPADAVILSAPAGAHGAAMIAARKGLKEPQVTDDTAPLNDLVHALLREDYGIRLIAYPEGGVQAELDAMTADTPWRVEVDPEAAAPSADVAAVCALSGLDSLTLPTTGAMLTVVSPQFEAAALAAIRRSAHGARAAVIARIAAG